MAQDNAAQSIKDLRSEIDALDKQLFVTNENFDLIGQTIKKTMENGVTSVEDLYKAIASKLKAKDVLKMKVIVERGQIEEAVKTLQEGIEKAEEK